MNDVFFALSSLFNSVYDVWSQPLFYLNGLPVTLFAISLATIVAGLVIGLIRHIFD